MRYTYVQQIMRSPTAEFVNIAYLWAEILAHDLRCLSLSIQYMKFGKNLSHAETALKVRQIGEYCIRKRLTALENNEEVPHDLLTLILQTVRESKYSYADTYIVNISFRNGREY